MISDNSDDSTVPSEVDPTPDYDFSFEVMDEDRDPAFQGLVPVPAKAWNARPTFASIGDPYVPASAATPADPGICPRSEVIDEGAVDNAAGSIVPPVTGQGPVPIVSGKGLGSSTRKGRQFLASRCVTPNLLSAPVWRAF